MCEHEKEREFMLKSSGVALYSTVHSGSWLDCTVIKAYHRGCICRLPWPKHFPLMDGHFHCLLTLNEACSSGLNWMLSTVSSYSPRPALSLPEPAISALFSALHACSCSCFWGWSLMSYDWKERSLTHIFSLTLSNAFMRPREPGILSGQCW